MDREIMIGRHYQKSVAGQADWSSTWPIVEVHPNLHVGRIIGILDGPSGQPEDMLLADVRHGRVYAIGEHCADVAVSRETVAQLGIELDETDSWSRP